MCGNGGEGGREIASMEEKVRIETGHWWVDFVGMVFKSGPITIQTNLEMKELVEFFCPRLSQFKCPMKPSIIPNSVYFNTLNFYFLL